VYARAAKDDSPSRESITPPEEYTYLGGFLDGKLVCVFILHETDLGQTCHFQALKDYRVEADVFGYMFLNETKGDIWARIPLCYPRVIEFARRHGFIEAGVDPGQFVKGGIALERLIMVRKCPG
jgi:hypothetical protein